MTYSEIMKLVTGYLCNKLLSKRSAFPKTGKKRKANDGNNTLSGSESGEDDPLNNDVVIINQDSSRIGSFFNDLDKEEMNAQLATIQKDTDDKHCSLLAAIEKQSNCTK